MTKPEMISQVEKPIQFDKSKISEIGLELIEVDDLVRAGEARSKFKVSGKDCTVAVLDTGLRTTHVDFEGRVISQVNFTSDNGGNTQDASDGQGHGTNVTGIIASNKLHVGIAPNANIVTIKVLNNSGGGSFENVADALQWIVENHSEYKITAICMSLGDSGNYRSDSDIQDFYNIRDKISQLRSYKIATVIAAGNDFFTHNSKEGMGFPAIVRECISVGAVYDENEGNFNYSSGATAYSSDKDRITPFSQRLHSSTSTSNATTIFAPGAPVTSSGINSDVGESIQHGTSQAAPVTVGAILLIQELYQRMENELPTIEQIEQFLKRGAKKIFDGDDEDDNVSHTRKEFQRLDIYDTLKNVVRDQRHRNYYKNCKTR